MSEQVQQVQQVVVGMDPHKRTVTIEVMGADETVLGGGRFDTTTEGYQLMLEYLTSWPDRVWGIEGCEGIGRHIAHRLLADEQDIVDVPAKLSARARVFATGQGRKTDATDAHSVALVATRMSGLRPVVSNDQLEVLQLLVDRRRSIGEEHTRKVSQLHRILLEMLPGGAKRFLSAAQARAILAGVRPAMRWARLVSGSRWNSWLTSSGSTPGRRARTRSSPRWWLRPGPGCWVCTASGPRARRGCSSRSGTCPGSRTATTSRPGLGPPPSTRPPGNTCVTASPGKATVRSTGCCTSWPPSSCAPRPRDGPTTTGRKPPGRPRWKRCGA